MGVFRVGEFNRETLPGFLRPFCPAMSATHLTDIDLQRLWERGKRLILLDVDHTLVPWKSEEFDPRVLAWIERAHGMGFEMCILSNTRHPARLFRICERLGIETVRGKLKPNPHMFKMALAKFGREAKEAVMVGDQLVTDVFGANRAGVEAVWVKKMAGAEFAGTRLNRFLESLLSGRIYRALTVTPEELEEEVVNPAARTLWERPIVRQFVKFTVVGGTSFLIDYSVRLTLLFATTVGAFSLTEVAGKWLIRSLPVLFGRATPYDAFFPVASGIAGAVAMLNSFVWNRMWTFSIRGKENRTEQLRRFLVVSAIGWMLNVAISTLLSHALPFDEKNNARGATILAAVLVAVWNFTGQRMYAFKAKAKP